MQQTCSHVTERVAADGTDGIKRRGVSQPGALRSRAAHSGYSYRHQWSNPKAALDALGQSRPAAFQEGKVAGVPPSGLFYRRGGAGRGRGCETSMRARQAAHAQPDTIGGPAASSLSYPCASSHSRAGAPAMMLPPPPQKTNASIA